jgi:YbbR domain-containing protein
VRAPSLRGFTHNWRLKLAALGLAVLIWAVVSSEQVTTQWIPVRIDPVVRDPEYVLGGAAEPAEVRVQFVGPGRELWELALDRPRLVLPLSNVGERRAFPVDPSMLRIPTGLSVRVQDIRPAVVRVDLQRLTSRTVPVRPRLAPASLARFVVEGEMEILPSELRVTGPADRLAALDGVATRAFDIVPDEGDSTFTRQVELDTAGLGGLTLSRGRVQVSGAIDLRGARPAGEVQVYVPDGLVAAPARVRVTLHGARRRVNAVDAAALRAVVARDSLPAAVPAQGVEAGLVLDGVPPGVTATTTPARVRVSAEPAQPVAPPPAAADSQPGAP